MPIIKSLLDTDLYKLTMKQYVFHYFPNVMVKYEFKCRTNGIDFKPFLRYIQQAIEEYRKLQYTADELSYLQSKPYMKQDFVDYLFNYKNDNNRIDTYIDDKGDLRIDVYGTWFSTIDVEVPILAIVNEIFFTYGKDRKNIEALLAESKRRLEAKIEAIKRDSFLGGRLFQFIEFGTRRRFSFENQFNTLRTLVQEVPKHVIGTSNVWMAKELGIEPKGTNAHEFTMAFQALVRLRDSQKAALQGWQDEYRGQLGIALGDTLGLDAFLRDFDLYFAKLYDGVRQDSGDPMWFYEKLVAHYKKLGVDPTTKTILFSDGLTIESAIALKNKVTEMKPLFGIGTSLTNDLGIEPLQIVMKMTECNNQPVAKISEASGKTMCNDPAYLTYLKNVFQIK
jgi:nicotinate phosphoribosyltransferase